MNNVIDIDVIWMRCAIILADYASLSGEVSVGAVLIYNGSIIGYGWNSSIIYNDPTAHAEILALRMGGKVLNNYRLLGTTLYVTLAPCMMCVGAIIHARIYRLVCGTIDTKSKYEKKVWFQDILQYPMINHRIFLTIGVLKSACSIQLNNFFAQKRKNYKMKFLNCR